jgi:hypothetical protein
LGIKSSYFCCSLMTSHSSRTVPILTCLIKLFALCSDLFPSNFLPNDRVQDPVQIPDSVYVIPLNQYGRTVDTSSSFSLSVPCCCSDIENAAITYLACCEPCHHLDCLLFVGALQICLFNRCGDWARLPFCSYSRSDVGKPHGSVLEEGEFFA